MEQIIVIDTDIFIDHFRGIREATNYLNNIDVLQRATTDVNVMELFKGASNRRELEIIEQFLSRNGFIKLPITARASRLALELLKQYSFSQGLGIPDALIAGIVLESKASLITGNLRHFQFITDLIVAEPSYRYQARG